MVFFVAVLRIDVKVVSGHIMSMYSCVNDPLSKFTKKLEIGNECLYIYLDNKFDSSSNPIMITDFLKLICE